METELMAPVIAEGFPMHISPMTLALLEDSGWYTGNFTALTSYTRGMSRGYKQGCAFATEKCLSNGVSTGSPAQFSTDTSHAPACVTGLCVVSACVWRLVPVTPASIAACRRGMGVSDGFVTTTALMTPFRYPTSTAGQYYAASTEQRDYCPSVCGLPRAFVPCVFPPTPSPICCVAAAVVQASVLQHAKQLHRPTHVHPVQQPLRHGAGPCCVLRNGHAGEEHV